MVFLRSTLALALLSLGGCTLITGDKVGDLEPDPVVDMRLQLHTFQPHLGQITDVWLVDEDGKIKARAIFDPLENPEQLVVLENAAVPLGTPDTRVVKRVDFYSDLNGSLGAPDYTGPIVPDPPTTNPENGRLVFPDHMWRVQLADGFAEFTHNIEFVDITTAGEELPQAVFFLSDLHLVLSGLDEQDGLPAEVRVYDDSADQDRQVGYYRLGAIDGATLDITIGGVFDEGIEYRVEISFDNGNPFCTRASGGTIEATLASLSPCPSQG